MTLTDRELTKLLQEIRSDVKAIRRSVDPEARGDEPRQTVRKKDPRALYGGG